MHFTVAKMANKKRRCSQCKSYKYTDTGIIIKSIFFCNLDCATTKAFKGIAKGREITHKAKKKEYYANDKATRREAAQKAFNAYIRARDSNLACVSCDKSAFWVGQWHCGHYKSVGARPDLRFNEGNTAKQCSQCNNFLSGNVGDYRLELIKRIGLDKVEWLEGPHEPKKYTCEDLKEIELIYKGKIKKLQQ